MRTTSIVLALVLFGIGTDSIADTFIHRRNRQVLHGYATSRILGEKTTIQTTEKGPIQVNLAEYEVRPDTQGRNNHVAVLSIPDSIDLEFEVAAFEKAIVTEADKGPLFILIEIDTPGGRNDLMMRLCGAITKTKQCRTVAYVPGGPNGGAYSAGAAIALACDKLYMARNTAMGGATSVLIHPELGIVDVEKVLGERAAEKISSISRNYFASLAQRNNRPGALAKAMENKDLEVIEVLDRGQHRFIESEEKTSNQKVVRVWSPKGKVLTLPAEDAVQCGMADKAVLSREEVLQDLNAATATIIENKQSNEAREQYKRMEERFEKMATDLETDLKQFVITKGQMDRRQALALFREMSKKADMLARIKKAYPDIPYDQENLDDLNSTLQAIYESIRSIR
ncbi:MAG: hypothetical protein JXA82_15090 [Sedimentisphaerales bacterium]|nr:hypothetical protein [Sedimentisphaerales bacterium]